MEKLLLVIKQVMRAIYKGHFDNNSLSHGARGVIPQAPPSWKKASYKDYVENRGKISISHTIQERPKMLITELEWEVGRDDTVAGKTGKSCLVTLTDRYYRFLKIQKVAVKKSKLVIEAMVKC